MTTRKPAWLYGDADVERWRAMAKRMDRATLEGAYVELQRDLRGAADSLKNALRQRDELTQAILAPPAQECAR